MPARELQLGTDTADSGTLQAHQYCQDDHPENYAHWLAEESTQHVHLTQTVPDGVLIVAHNLQCKMCVGLRRQC